jgi:N6-adenosine-specific RNA methylase IME4
MVLANSELHRVALIIQNGRHQIESAGTLQEILNILQQASAAVEVLKRMRGIRDDSHAMQNAAAEIKVRAERKLGQMTRDMEKRTGGDAMKARSHAVTEFELQQMPPTYADLGLDKMAVSRWQAIASVPEERFEEFIKKSTEAQEELTSAALHREAKRILAQEQVKDITFPQGKYRVIYADPPWKYQNTMPDYFYEQADHYPLLTVEEVAALPIKELACDDAVLFLWATSPILEESFEVIKAWGFEYKASFVWDKVKHNMGHYNSVRHELLLVCVRGSCQPDVKTLFDSVVSEERRDHSRKPDVFYGIIETLYIQGPKVELFQRGNPRDGWEPFGYETVAGEQHG